MKVRITLYTNKVGSSCSTVADIDDEDWEALEESEQNDLVTEMFLDGALHQLGGWDWEVES